MPLAKANAVAAAVAVNTIILMMICEPSKLGQTDLVFGLTSEFISCVHAELQVVCV